MPRGHTKGFRWTTPEARFWKHVQITDGCWLWVGYCLPVANHPELRGHGQIRVEGRVILVHRFSWELHYGPIDPPSLLVCHTCDNPPCVRPDHLFLGTHADNTGDAMHKGRMILHPENLRLSPTHQRQCSLSVTVVRPSPLVSA